MQLCIVLKSFALAVACKMDHHRFYFIRKHNAAQNVSDKKTGFYRLS